MRSFFERVKELGIARGGNVPVILALCAVPLALVSISMIDVSRMTRMKSALQAAAEPEALAALAPLASGKPADTDVRDVLEANLFENFGNPGDVQITDDTLTITRDQGVSTATLQVSADLEAFYVDGPLGQRPGVTVTSTATTGKPSYLDVHFWLDGSGSMHLPADEAGRDQLRQLSAGDPGAGNCAFACHIPSSLSDSTYLTSYERARANGVNLRTDVMREATQEVIDVLSVFNTPIGRVRFSIHKFAHLALAIEALTSDTTALSDELAR